jgi:hypothetical protein
MDSAKEESTVELYESVVPITVRGDNIRVAGRNVDRQSCFFYYPRRVHAVLRSTVSTANNVFFGGSFLSEGPPVYCV